MNKEQLEQFYIQEDPWGKFLSYVKKTNKCWEWQGSIGLNGYGSFSYQYKQYSAHRTAYKLYKGEIPKGLFVCHTCDNRRCVNPKHLFLGTIQENVADMVAKGRSAKGEKHSQSKLTEPDILKIREIKKEKSLSNSKIAELFNVHRTCIDKIIRKKHWVHI